MQKISGILPSSSRVTAVDVKEGGVVRPGAPSFGRPMGESNLFKNSVIRSAHQAIQKQNELWDAREDEQNHSKTIQDMADAFFKSRHQLAKERALVNELVASQQPIEAPPTVSIPKIQLPEPQVMKDKTVTEMSEEELAAPEIGRYLNVVA
ncbi:MAG: hypothetical protein KDD40_04550 [Bdellovibrionales bacterium]|nr:hypothetical protein [Bdellovibrionales bacterium]